MRSLESRPIREYSEGECKAVLEDIRRLYESLLYEQMDRLIQLKVEDATLTLKNPKSTDIQIRIAQGALQGYEYGILVLRDISSRVSSRLDKLTRQEGER